MTQEFHLSVTPIGNSEYLVRTERVPFGVPLAEEQLSWAVETWLTEAAHLMSDPLQGLMQGNPASLNLVALGQELFTALFQGTLRDSWVIAQGVAQHRREALRLRLGLKGSDLPRLPWEVMYGADVPIERLRRQPGNITSSPRPLATGTRIIFSRYQWGTRLVEESPLALSDGHQPLRILMVVSAPTDQEQLKLYREVKQMQQQLQTQPARSEGGGESAPDIQLTILNQPGRERLTQALVQGRYHALHYAGHSDLSAEGGSLYLVNNHTGLTEVLTGNDLVDLLVNNGIRLAVFNSCRSAYVAASDPNQGRDPNLAEVLVSRGIPAVLAMAEQIPDNVALNLAVSFYHSLKQGLPIDLSLNRARQGLITSYGSHQFYWALPVLYLHPDFDGYLLSRDRSRENPADRLSSMPGSDRVPPSPQSEPPPGREFLVEKQPLRGVEEKRRPDASGLAGLEALEEAPSEEANRQVVAELLQPLPPVSPSPQSLPTGNHPVVQAVSTVTERATVDSAINQSTTNQSAIDQAVDRTGLNSSGFSSSPPPIIPTQLTPAGAQSTAQLPKPENWWSNRFLWLPLIGAVVVALGYSIGQLPLPEGLPWQPTVPEDSAPSSVSTIGDPPVGIDPNQSDEELQAFASDNFKEEQVDAGIEAVKALLDRGALKEAAEAIQTVPKELTDDARINFLRGRLAWQGAEKSDGVHTLEQARQFWESSAATDPDTLVYRKALAFAYYAEGNLNEVIQTWYAVQDRPTLDQNMLSIEAVNALAQYKIAATQPPNSQKSYERAAVQNYHKVIKRDPKGFTPEALRQSWFWTDKAIQDWAALEKLATAESPKASPVPQGKTPQYLNTLDHPLNRS